MQQDLNTHIFEELMHYVKDAHSSFSLDNEFHSTRAVPEVPTAALITGVNMPDHAMMFTTLVSELHSLITPHVAVLQAKDCSNLSALMTKTLSQLIQTNEVIGEDVEEEQLNMRRISCTMSVLASWYTHIVKKSGSPRKRTNSGSPSKVSSKKCPPIVIVMKDLEAFNATVIQEFLTICCNNLYRLPFVLVFGIATAVTAVHRLLPSSVSSLLCIEKFQAPPASEYLTHLINKVLMTPSQPFKLGPKTFHLLLDLFLYHDFSIVNFTRNFQLCLLEHFRTHPCSILCQALSDAEDHVVDMKSSDIDLIRNLSSFRRYVEDNSPEKQIRLLEDEEYTKGFILKMLRRLDDYHTCFFPILQCLHIFTRQLPGYPLGKQIREMYGISLSSSIFDTEGYKQSLFLLRSMSRDELIEMVCEASLILCDDEIPDEIHLIGAMLQEYEVKLRNIEALSEIHETEAAEVTSRHDGDTEQDDGQLPKKMGMYELRQKLQAMEKKKKKLSLYETIRNEMIDYLDSICRKYLIIPQSLVLHEILYYNNANDIRKQINGSPRVTIQKALSNPYHYLQHEDLRQDETGSIKPMLPDICIVYKLHLECSKLINLYDWLQAFVMVIEANEDEENIHTQQQPNTTLQARFIRAVSELQFLGFIKPTKRKTDHVARLTWGGC